MNWKQSKVYPSGMTLWTLDEATDKFKEVTIHHFGPVMGYTVTLDNHQTSHFHSIDAAKDFVEKILTMTVVPKRRSKKNDA